jgi:hypothetical protein
VKHDLTCPVMRGPAGAGVQCGALLDSRGECWESNHRAFDIQGNGLNSGAIFDFHAARWKNGNEPLYRFALWRTVEQPSLFNDRARQWIAFAGLNPSKAGATVDDPTINVCRGYTQRWGYGGFFMINKYAWRETDSQRLYQVTDPIGEHNDHVLRWVASRVALIVACWGNNAPRPTRARQVCEIFDRAGRPPQVLRLTNGGHPHHPLRLPGTLKPSAWSAWRAA